MGQRTNAPLFVYLDTVAAVEELTARIAGVTELALDTEGASFHRFIDRIYLLQLSTRDTHAVIDPLPIGRPTGLGRLLEDPAVEVVFHDADYDLRLLEQDYGWKIKHIFDTRIAAQLLGYTAFGLAALLERFFGVKLDKKHQRADWSMRPLTADMLDYAAQDTRYLLELKDLMSAELDKVGRMPWAREEFALLEGTRWADEEPGMGFLKLKGARDLTRRELAVLRELVPWRDAVAKQMDRATFRVLGNEQLLDISRTQPQTRDALAKIKGMPRGILEQRGADMLDAVKRALAVPDAELPRFPKAARWDRDADFDTRVSALKTARDEAAKRLVLDPGVLCSRDRLEAVARRNPSTVDELMEVTELRRWQARELAEGFVAALVPHRGSTPPSNTPPRVPAARRATSADASPYSD
ncbi:MAG TPA: HRDC domain-containing protein [Gemmatimonadaceae bacterium]|nr:HRDC domain-containing protein [Gemmatimonadaceae bacterium]